MQFRTYKIDAFDDLVDCIWFLEYNGKQEKLLTPANQYFNITFSIGSPYKRDSKALNSPQIEGISQQQTLFEHTSSNKIVGIKLLPFGLYPFIEGDMSRLLNTSTNLSDIIGHKATLYAQKLKKAGDDYECIEAILDFLHEQFNSDRYQNIKIPEQGYYHFKQMDQSPKVYSYNNQINISYPTLNKYFLQVIGLSPKKVERLLKFRKSLCTMTSSQLDLTRIGYQSGYFDQAHFIKEFSRFMNCQPKRFLRRLSEQKSEIKICYNFSIF